MLEALKVFNKSFLAVTDGRADGRQKMVVSGRSGGGRFGDGRNYVEGGCSTTNQMSLDVPECKHSGQRHAVF